MVKADNGVSLDFAETTGAIPQHYAFLVGEEEFDAAFGRIRGQDLPYWAGPGQTQPRVINHWGGGRGLYFKDPDGHLLRSSPGLTAAAANPLPAWLVRPSQAEPPPTANRPICGI